MKLQQNEAEHRRSMQLLCLIAAAASIFPFLIADSMFPGYGSYLKEKFMPIPSLLFFGSVLSQQLSGTARKNVLLSAAMVLLFVVVQTQHWLIEMGNSNFAVFAAVYLLAFPYASVAEKKGQCVGLNWVGGICVAYSLLMTALTGMLLVDAVPEMLAASVRWEGTRLSVFTHPNGVGGTLLIGIGFSLFFLMKADRKWKKYVLAALTLLQFLAQILTNSRTSIFLACALFAGTVFFVLWNGTWKRFLSGAVMALAVIAVLFSLSGKVFDLHTEAQITKLMNQTEAEAAENGAGQQLHINEQTGEITVTGTMVSSQGELSSDMKTLNGRIWIWAAAFSSLLDNPSYQVWGTEYASAEISYRMNTTVANAHNAWVQTLMEMGFFGYVMATVFTLVAVWHLWKEMWRKNGDMSRKIVAMIVICVLLASVLESYLFVGGMNLMNFVFFLCTGYLIQWNAEAAGKV